ncbi:MAG: hypothetical protein STSR0008_01930 [Ignavibacterium sp.]
MLKEEIKNIKESAKDLKKFGLTIGSILVFISGFLYWKHYNSFIYFLVIGILIMFFGVVIPIVLKPLNKIWMIIAVLLGYVMTRIILSLLFYLILTPIGIIGRLSGSRKFSGLDLKINKNQKSYWIEREKKINNKEDYEKQY